VLHEPKWLPSIEGGQKPYEMDAETRVDFPRVTDSLLPWPQSIAFGQGSYRKFSVACSWRATLGVTLHAAGGQYEVRGWVYAYRLNVEIAIKCWKSVLDMDALRAKAHSPLAEVWLHGKLL